MLEVGNPPGGTGESPSFENPHSWRAHFGAWLINSSPLILSFDLSNLTKLNLTWDFITNREALKINSGGPRPTFVHVEKSVSLPVDSRNFLPSSRLSHK
eukprot:COSAG02_NODE_19729_length_867_cov_1.125000_2_plen_98_part_01